MTEFNTLAFALVLIVPTLIACGLVEYHNLRNR